MNSTEINAVVTANEEKGTPELSARVTYNMPESVAEAIDMYGEDIVFMSIIRPEVVKKVQAGMRSLLKAGKSQDEIQAWADSWKPGMVKPKKSKLEKVKSLSRGLTEEELRELLNDIKSRH